MAQAQDGCVFCGIASGKIPSKKIYEDADCLAFLDIYPAAKGHCLLAPKKHYPTLLDIPEFELKGLSQVLQKIAAASARATKADGFNILQNNGEAAGQVIHHLHFHIIPRFKNDGIKGLPATRKAEEEELKQWEKNIKEHL